MLAENYSVSSEYKFTCSLLFFTVEKPLDGKVAIVTGASSGIGASVALHLARAGAKVALAARREERLHKLKETIEMEGGVAIAVRADVTNRKDVSWFK